MDKNKLQNTAFGKPAKELRFDIHSVLKQANYDYERMQYNTVVSAVMKMLNTLEDAKLGLGGADPSTNASANASTKDDASAVALAECFSILLRVLYPACPHIAYALWRDLGYAAIAGDLLDTAWAEVDESALVRDEIELMLQINGKLRGALVVPAQADKAAIEAAALATEVFMKQAAGAAPKKIIVVPRRLVNIVL
jgi:leucyl-tRNA synthetase